MKALYRRYRPKTLAEVIGQEQITSVLEKSLQNGKLSHAYLFIGPRGTGKTSVARILAHRINDFDYELEDDYLDIIEIDAASNRGIDNIRELRERAAIAPAKGKYKIYIIDEVHMLTREAFNALLKTLEEPPAHVVFIMATTDAEKVPITITSRSQIYTFKLADPSTMFSHLKTICSNEKINIDDEALKIVVRRGGGSFRDTLSLLDQISTMSDEKITADMINHALGLPKDEVITEILNAYKGNDSATIRSHLTELANSNIKSETIAKELIDRILSSADNTQLALLDKLIDVIRSPFPDAKLLIALCNNNQTVAVAPPPVQVATYTKTVAATPNAVTETVSATVSEPTPTAPPPQPVVKQLPNDAGAAEIWQAILENVAKKSPMLTSDIVSSKYTYKDGQLKIYTGNYLKAKNIEKRRALISEVLPNNIEVEISRETLADDPEVANIAAIMGGGEEIQIDV